MFSNIYEWDETKRADNFEKHGIDFYDAIDVFQNQHVVIRSDRNNEERWTALGMLANVIVAVAFAKRGDTKRLISARLAHRHERKQYHARLGSGSPSRENRLESLEGDDG